MNAAIVKSRSGTLHSPIEDENAMRALYKSHGNALFAYVLTLVSWDRDLAADVVQETMLRAWRTGGMLDRTRSLRPWLRTVARRVVIDTHRRRLSRPQEADGTFLEKIADGDEIDATLTKVVLVEALSSLSEPHRAVLYELYYKRSNNQQAAEALGIPMGTVRSRCHYALGALRLALEERGVTGRI